jgi:hypothetical protein
VLGVLASLSLRVSIPANLQTPGFVAGTAPISSHILRIRPFPEGNVNLLGGGLQSGLRDVYIGEE